MKWSLYGIDHQMFYLDLEIILLLLTCGVWVAFLLKWFAECQRFLESKIQLINWIRYFVFLGHPLLHTGKSINLYLHSIAVSVCVFSSVTDNNTFPFSVRHTKAKEPKKLSRCFPKLGSVTNAEELAASCLHLEPRDRISSRNALKHAFFSELPYKLYTLPDRKYSWWCLTFAHFCSLKQIFPLHMCLDVH